MAFSLDRPRCIKGCGGAWGWRRSGILRTTVRIRLLRRVDPVCVVACITVRRDLLEACLKGGQVGRGRGRFSGILHDFRGPGPEASHVLPNPRGGFGLAPRLAAFREQGGKAGHATLDTSKDVPRLGSIERDIAADHLGAGAGRGSIAAHNALAFGNNVGLSNPGSAYDGEA